MPRVAAEWKWALALEECRTNGKRISHRGLRRDRSRSAADSGTDHWPNGPGSKTKWCCPRCSTPGPRARFTKPRHSPPKIPAASSGSSALGPKAKLQQVMMTVAQKVAFELVPVDGPIGGFPDAHATLRPCFGHRMPFPDWTARSSCSSADGNRLRAARASRCNSSASASASPTSFRGRPDRPPRRRLL